MRFSQASALELATAALRAARMRPEDALLVADILVETDPRGVTTHGSVRLPIYLNNLRTGVDPAAPPRPLV